MRCAYAACWRPSRASCCSARRARQLDDCHHHGEERVGYPQCDEHIGERLDQHCDALDHTATSTIIGTRGRAATFALRFLGQQGATGHGELGFALRNTGSSACHTFRLGVTHGINSTAGCSTAAALQLIPPDDTASVRTQILGGAFDCRTATVSPLRSGASAYP